MVLLVWYCGLCRYGLHRAAPVHQLSISQEKMPRKIVDAILSRSRPVSVAEIFPNVLPAVNA